ncbi:MAG: 16S rRNA processing protein RimM [Clostridiaceae bacterium]|nr:16S rRNA processing protein RimM [Clostridiaceae bacterium]
MTNKLSEKLVIGRLGKARGLKGEIRVKSLSDDPKRFINLETCQLENEAGNVLSTKEVVDCRVINQDVWIRFKDVSDRDAAESLRGLYLSVDREDAIPLTEDSFFVVDLIGCSVYDQEKGLLGKVSYIQSNPSADIIYVKKAGEEDLLYPNLKTIVKNIDLENKRIDVVLPDGLYEIYR